MKKKIYYYLKNLIFDFKSLSLSSKLLCLLPISIVLGPFISDGSLVFIVLVQLYESYKKRNFQIFKNTFLKIFLFFWIISLVSSFMYYSVGTIEFNTSIKSSFTFIRFGIFAVIIGLLIDKEEKILSVFTKILFLTLVFVIIHALLIYFLRFDFLKPTQFTFYNFEHLTTKLDVIQNRNLDLPQYWYDHRISGVFYDELILGGYLLKLGFLYFSLSILNNFQKSQLFSIIFLIILLFTILITGDRSPTVLSLMGFVMIVFLIRFKFVYKCFFITLLFSLVFLFVFKDPNLKNRFVEQIQGYQKQKLSYIKIFDRDIWYFSDGHAQHVLTALRIFKDNQILGTGSKTFRFQCRKKEYNINKYSCSSHPHNIYAQLLAENGIIGFVIVFSFFVYIFITIARNYFGKNLINYNALQSLMILLFLLLWPIIPTGNFYNNSFALYNFLILGFVLHFIKLEKNNEN